MRPCTGRDMWRCQLDVSALRQRYSSVKLLQWEKMKNIFYFFFPIFEWITKLFNCLQFNLIPERIVPNKVAAGAQVMLEFPESKLHFIQNSLQERNSKRNRKFTLVVLVTQFSDSWLVIALSSTLFRFFSPSSHKHTRTVRSFVLLHIHCCYCAYKFFTSLRMLMRCVQPSQLPVHLLRFVLNTIFDFRPMYR